MDKMFDFDSVDKKMPYKVDEDFFARNAEVLKQKFVRVEQRRKMIRKIRLVLYNSAAVLFLTVLINLYEGHQSEINAGMKVQRYHSIEKLLQSASDDELNQLESIASADPFLN